MNSLFYLDGELFIECDNEELDKYKYLDHVIPTEDSKVFNYVPAKTHNLTRKQYEEFMYLKDETTQMHKKYETLVSQNEYIPHDLEYKLFMNMDNIHTKPLYIIFNICEILRQAKSIDLDTKTVKIMTTVLITKCIESSKYFKVEQVTYYNIRPTTYGNINYIVNDKFMLIDIAENNKFISEFSEQPLYTYNIDIQIPFILVIPKTDISKIKIVNYTDGKYNDILKYYIGMSHLSVMTFRI